MGRSNGYRPTKATEKQVMYLRAKLGKVRASEWQKASCIMQEITGLLGHRGGPGNSMIPTEGVHGVRLLWAHEAVVQGAAR